MLIKSDPAVMAGYLEDSSNLKGGMAERVFIPQTAEEVALVLKEANSRKMPVTVSGGGTGTAGGRIPYGGAVLSTERLNKPAEVKAVGAAACAQAGLSVEEFKKTCEAKGLFFTSHPTEKSAFMGGAVSTNASGSRSFKYGPMRRYVRRLEMALADGTLFALNRGEQFLSGKRAPFVLPEGRVIEIPMPGYRMPAVKSSSGYFAKDGMDAIDLFIGQEGTLSVITGMEIGLVPKPAEIFSAFVFFDREEDAWLFAGRARPRAMSIEYFDSNALGILRPRRPDMPASARAAVFIEEEAAEGARNAVAGAWLDIISQSGGSADATWAAMNEKEVDDLAAMRYYIPERINEIVVSRGYPKLSTDIAVPQAGFEQMARFYMTVLKEAAIDHVVFGHIGECHLHVNLLPRSGQELEVSRGVCLSFIRKAIALGGTVSAEHGIGKARRQYLEMMYGREGVIEMARIKKALDPNGILGRGNIFTEEIFALA